MSRSLGVTYENDIISYEISESKTLFCAFFALALRLTILPSKLGQSHRVQFAQ